MVEVADGELVAQTRAGDADAYGALVARYQGHVYGLAYSFVENWAEAQDIAQETFIRAYLNLDQLQDPVRFAAWLRRVTFSVAMNWLRTYRPKLFAQLDGRVDLDLLEVPDFRPGPAEVVEKRELAEVVLRAVQALPPKYRAPLTMFHLDGLSYQKVADFLDIPLGTAKALIHRARAKLKEALTPYLTEEMAPMVQEVFNEHKLPAEFARKVLDNVPKLAWGTNRECTFLGALEAALAITDRPYCYSDLMGWSGMAFRARWWSKDEPPRWCPSCAVAEMEEETAAVSRATGWPLHVEFLTLPPGEESPAEADSAAHLTLLTRRVTEHIDGGKAVLAYEPRLNMAVVYGYEGGGETLLLRDYFHGDEPLRLAPAKLGFLMYFLGERGEPLPPREALLESLRIAVRNWERERFSEGPGEYWYGRAALARWAADLGHVAEYDDEQQAALRGIGWWVFTSLRDARQAAVTFLRANARLLPQPAADAMRSAADRYEQEVTFLTSACADGVPFSNDAAKWSAQTRQREIEILTRMRETEEAAVAKVKAALAAVD